MTDFWTNFQLLNIIVLLCVIVWELRKILDALQKIAGDKPCN